ncbi:MAG: hypothetical protein ACKVJG_26750 [Candidatus Latescibacterota bacterium]
MVKRLLIERDLADGESLNAEGSIRIEGSVSEEATIKARGRHRSGRRRDGRRHPQRPW